MRRTLIEPDPVVVTNGAAVAVVPNVVVVVVAGVVVVVVAGVVVLVVVVLVDVELVLEVWVIGGELIVIIDVTVVPGDVTAPWHNIVGCSSKPA
jgi:hypothetical protein